MESEFSKRRRLTSPARPPVLAQNFFPAPLRPTCHLLRGSIHGPFAQAKLLSGLAAPANHIAGRLNAAPLWFFDPPKSQRHRSKGRRAILGRPGQQPTDSERNDWDFLNFDCCYCCCCCRLSKI
jgi:hypothetical protein